MPDGEVPVGARIARPSLAFPIGEGSEAARGY